MKLHVGHTLANAIAEVEGLGGTLMAVSGAGLAALFGAPEAHEDDPERAVRAGFRMLSAFGPRDDPTRPGGRLSLRIGIETGSVVVGPLWRAARRRLRCHRPSDGDRRRSAIGGEAWLGIGGPGDENCH